MSRTSHLTLERDGSRAVVGITVGGEPLRIHWQHNPWNIGYDLTEIARLHGDTNGHTTWDARLGFQLLAWAGAHAAADDLPEHARRILTVFQAPNESTDVFLDAFRPRLLTACSGDQARTDHLLFVVWPTLMAWGEEQIGRNGLQQVIGKLVEPLMDKAMDDEAGVALFERALDTVRALESKHVASGLVVEWARHFNYLGAAAAHLVRAERILDQLVALGADLEARSNNNKTALVRMANNAWGRNSSSVHAEQGVELLLARGAQWRGLAQDLTPTVWKALNRCPAVRRQRLEEVVRVRANKPTAVADDTVSAPARRAM
jgi:hypothetical protein